MQKRFWSVLALFVLSMVPFFGFAQQGNTDEVTIIQGLFPETLDPHLTTVQATHNVSTQIYEPLVVLNYDTMEHTPLLAESWTQVDPLTWEFKLREGVKFTNGEEFTAETVKYNFDRIARPELNSPVWNAELKVVTGTEVVDDYTIRLMTESPAPTLLLALNRLYMVPMGYAEEAGDDALASQPVGTGPFMLEDFRRDDSVVLVANPDYWGGAPELDRVTFKGIPEASTRVAALRAGEADLITNLNILDIPSIEADENLEVIKVPSLRNMYVILDETNGGPIADPKVRLALNYAVDRDLIIDALLEGNARPLQGQWISDAYFGFNPDLEPYEYDPERARELLAEAGYQPEDITVTFYTPTGRYVMDSEVAQAVAGMLQDLGINVDLRTVEWATFINDLVAKEMSPLMFIGMSTTPDANYHLGLHRAGNAYSYYENPEFDAIMNEAAQLTDPEERLELYRRATELMHEDPPGILLYQQVDIYGKNQRFQGWEPRPDERIILLGTEVAE